MSPLPGRLVLLGHPVSHSLSPRFQNAALHAAGIPLVYEACDVEADALESTVLTLREQNAAGNVTIPHKQAFAACCDRRSALAERCGAVNTFWLESGMLVGDNTDVGGVDAVAFELLAEARKSASIALIGAGGSAAAVLAAAERWGSAHVRLYNRHMQRAQTLAERFGAVVTVAPSLASALDGATLVINATPVGLRNDEHPVDIALLPRGAAVFDLAYRAGETSWVRAARAAGHRAADGEGMLIEQGALAFQRWFGIEPDRNAMWRAMR